MNFTKKEVSLIALACGAALVAPTASAQWKQMPLNGQALTITGNIGGGIGRVKAAGASAGAASDTVARTVVTPGDNAIQFLASYKFDGPFIKALGLTMEAGFDTDTGTSGASAGILFSRNTGVGVRTDFGDIWTGKWDTPFKGIGGAAAVTGTATGVSASTTSILRSPGMGFSGGGVSKGGGSTSGNDNMGFDRRQTNSIAYASPMFSDTQVFLLYSPDEETVAGTAGPARATLFGAGVQYKNGPLYLGYAYDRHQDFLWGATSVNSGDTKHAFGIGSPSWGQGTESLDTGHLLVANYTFGNTTLKAYWDRLRWTQAGGTALLTELQKDDWYLGVQQQLGGPHGIRVGYNVAQSYKCTPSTACGTETGAVQLNVVYEYKLSKDASLWAFWGRQANDRQANYKPSGAASSVSVGGVDNPAGKTYTGYSVTLTSNF